MSELSQAKEGFGELLRTTREKLGLSINDVSIATKISPRVLKALESSSREELPAPSFSRGFIRSYAAYLKIDPSPILQEFGNLDHGIAGAKIAQTTSTSANDAQPNLRENEGETVPEGEVEPESSVPEASPKNTTHVYTTSLRALTNAEEAKTSVRPTWAALNDPSMTNKIVLAGVFLVGALLVFGIKRIIDKYAQERVIEPPAIQSEKMTPELKQNEAKQSETTPSDDIQAESKALKSGEVESDEPVKKMSDTGNAPPPTKAIEATQEKSTPGDTASTVSDNKESVKNAATIPVAGADAKKPTSVKKPTPQEVIIEALDKVSVTVTIDNEAPKQMTLSPESLNTIKAKEKIQIESADGGMISIIYNGKDRGVPGDLGKPIKIKYP